MKIIHTSDWHLGQNFMFKDRKKEHEKFLEWLMLLIQKESADVLIVAGDIFDSISPPNYALKMYYSFLARVSSTTPCHTFIVGGNHDSVSTLNAPKNILEALNVHVTGGISGNVDDEVIVIKNGSGEPAGIICAVPFLRDRDIRKSVPGESYQEKSRALLEGIRQHYELVKNSAIKKKTSLTGKKIPVIATGHLFAEGGEVKEEEGLREIYVGSLGQVTPDTFPIEFDYVALGHLHRPQQVGGHRRIRYSGAPIPLSFSESDKPKQVVCITFDEGKKEPEIKTIEIPEFQKLRTAKGSLEQVIAQLDALRRGNADDPIWVEVSVLEETWKPDIENTINDLANELELDILAIKNLRSFRDRSLRKSNPSETLDDFTPESVFQKRLEKEKKIEEDLKNDLIHAFHEILNTVNESAEDFHESS
ncbi:MAG: exonuclease SbcCD subunit D C-terminal domain-containing protein [Desulfobacterales bacterium]